MKKREAFLEEISGIIDKSYLGDNILINGLGLCNRETQYESIISYITSSQYIDSALSNLAVRCLILTEAVYNSLSAYRSRFSFIITESPEDVFYLLHNKLYQETDFYEKPSSDPIIGLDCNIHRSVIIEKGVNIGDNVTIGANSVLNTGVSIGSNTHIGCCTVIGSEGFQILRDVNGIPYNVQHVGGTVIGNNVWIGDNVTIGNSIFEGFVKIGNNCQIDNHSYIAHNCIIGDNNVITAGVRMMGSSEIKNNCWIAPNATILNRVLVEDCAIVGANSLVRSDVTRGTTVVGSPAIAIENFSKIREQFKKILKS